MKKRLPKIVYWVATLWLALGMASTGIVQLLRIEEETSFIIDLGYPEYILTLLGVTKLLGVVAILIPRFPVVKEWAYAGFTFMMLAAVYSHIAAGRPGEVFPALLLVVLTSLSWYFRPATRRMAVTV
jgi:uncharacterized membrane protein YphA (DoxX/SURF4 family)